MAIAADGGKVYIAGDGSSSLDIIDTTSDRIAKTVETGKIAARWRAYSRGKDFYFTEADVPAVQVLDAASDKIVVAIPGGGPGELMLFDPATNQVARSIPVGKQPHWAALSGDGMTAYVTNEGSNNVSVVDLASGKATTIPVGHGPRKIVVPKEEKRADASAANANFAFSPSKVMARPGQSVTWSNDDGSPHALIIKDGAAAPQTLLPGQSFTRTFDRVGTYGYSCSFHPYMTGKVLVAEGNS